MSERRSFIKKSAIGALGATVLTVIQKKFSFKILQDVAKETMKLTTMVFFFGTISIQPS